jgi:hypothetical protein
MLGRADLNLKLKKVSASDATKATKATKARCKHPNIQAFKHSSIQAFKHSDSRQQTADSRLHDYMIT